MSSSTPGQGQGQGQGQGKKEAEGPGIFSFLLSDTLGASKEPLSITIILKFFIFLLVAIV